MNQKIEWYREVLELEPGSRVFFPLAKLLVAEGDAVQAIKTLQLGISRHPDHIEARLLLVEILAAIEREKELHAELASLGELFRSYPEFWKIWSRHLAATPAMQDAALALSFFSAALDGRQITWASVIAHGLRALLGEMAAGETPPVPAGPASGPVPRPVPGQVAGLPSFLTDPPEVTGSAGKEPEGTGVAEAGGEGALPIDAAILPEEIFERGAPSAPEPAEAVAPTDSGEPAALTKGVLSLAAEDAAEIGRIGSLSEGPKEPKIEPEDEPEDEPEEPFSLRTRSMAEILAEQGDISAALEIYQELLLAASDGEKPELAARIEELSAPGGMLAAHSSAREDEPRDDGNRLASLLESLAQRLEERAR